MPLPTAGLLNKPLMTLILVFSGSSGCRLLLNFMSAPDPFAHQWLPLMPLPMNRTAKRRGNGAAMPLSPAGAAGSVAAPHTGIDSSQGNAIVTPTPRRNLRLDIRSRQASADCSLGSRMLVVFLSKDVRGSFRHELG